MPRRAAQSSAALTVPAAANPLGRPGAIVIFALPIPNGAAVLAWTGIAGLSFRVLECWFVKTAILSGNLGVNTVALRDSTNAYIIPAAAPLNIRNIPDQTIVRTTRLVDATRTIGAGLGMQAEVISAGGDDTTGILYVQAAIL